MTQKANRLQSRPPGLITETGGNTLLLTWTAWQVGSGYCTTIADALAHLRSCPQGNDPLEFIFGDLLTRFTAEEERIVATLSYPTEPIPITAIAEISAVDEPTTRRARKLLTNRSIVAPPREGEEKHALVPIVAEFIRRARCESVRQSDKLSANDLFLAKRSRELRSWPCVTSTTSAPSSPTTAAMNLLCVECC